MQLKFKYSLGERILTKRKIGSLFDSGLVSRIYIAAFSSERTSYEIAKMIVPGSPPQSACGRILQTARNSSGYFIVKTRRVSEYKMRTLIKSNAEPFFLKLAKECQLSADELNVLRSFEEDFRRAIGIYLELTLKRDPNYLMQRDINAFKELATALCLTLYIARLSSQASAKARLFSFSMLSRVLPSLINALGLSNEKFTEISRELMRITSEQVVASLYTKVKKIISPEYKLVLQALEWLENYFEEAEKRITK